MATVINMPRLSDTMEEGVVAKWNKKVGDTVKSGDILAEIETDKATMDFESFYDGVLLHIGVQEGEAAPVDTLLAIIGEKGEDISDLIKNPKEKSTETTEEKKEASTPKDTAEQPQAELPQGIEIIRMPRLSDTMEEGTVAKWNKKEGDSVKSGEILAEIETDKATMDFESFYDGTLLKIGIPEGQSAPVDSVLAIIGPSGTDVSSIDLSQLDSTNSTTESITAKEEKQEAKTETKTETQSSVASTQQAAPDKTESKRIFVSPLAKKIAQEKGIDLRLITGSGEHGRIVKRDVENYQPTTGPAYIPVGVEQFEEVPNSQMRKTIAKRLSESKYSAPHYYLTIELDMDHAIASRSAINEMAGTKVSFNDMIVKACAMALRKHPQVNSQWNGNTIRLAKHIHIGVAVAVDDGLVVPVLKFADQMSFVQINTTVKELAAKARNKKLKPDEMEGSTFTVSNLGMFGIKEFTSIINQPNSSILSVGAIIEKPVVKNGQIVVGNTMTITMANDHRTVDGATGALFLQTLKQYIENPITMFI